MPAAVAPGRILVTGATGFVGRHLLPVLGRAFPEAVLLTQGFDVADRAATEAAIGAARPDAVVHLAAVAAIPAARRDPDRAWQVNLHGTLHLARALQTTCPEATFLFASSADAYGAAFRAGEPVREDMPLAPLNAYGATKAAADLALGAMAAEGLRVLRMRPFNHTGSGQSPAFVVAAFARQAARIRAGLQPPVLDVGALDPQRDFLDVDDVCAAYALALREAPRLEPGVILNLASGTPRRIGDVLQAVLDAAGVEAKPRTDAGRLRPTDIPMACGNASRARALLGWGPAVPWQQTIQAVVADWTARVQAGDAEATG